MSTLRTRSRVARRFREGLRVFPSWLVLSLLWLGVIEWLGRQFQSDLGDVIPALALCGLGVALFFRHRSVGIPGVRTLGARIQKLWRTLLEKESDCGLDFRCTPPLPARCPPLTLACFATTGALALLAWLSAGRVPSAVRSTIAPHFYVGYLVLVTLLWALLIAGTVSFLFITYALLHDTLINQHVDARPRSRRPEALVTSLLFLLILGALFFAPTQVPILVLSSIAAIAVTASLWPGIPRVLVSWKAKPETTTYGLRLARLYLLHFLSVVFSVVALLFLCRREMTLAAAEAPGSAMPVTEILALIFAWTATVSLLLCTPSCLRELWFHLRCRWARDTRPVLLIRRPLSRRMKRAVQAVMGRHGWTVRFGGGKRIEDAVEVKLRLPGDGGPPAEEAADELRGLYPPSWPLDLTLDALHQAPVQRQLQRRNEIQRRRILLRRLERMFKLVRRRKFEKGEGLWIGCQHWFIAGLFRDEAEDDFDDREDHFLSDRIGPSFSRLLPWSVRSHYREVMEALRVDLIFVEDGVSFRNFKRVLRVLFEIYDVHGGRQVAEERYFTGIPGVRVVLDEIDLNTSFITPGYPEPDYEDIGRARILHVFRDRGEDDEEEEAPTPWDTELLPLSV